MPPGNNLHRVVVYRDGGDRAIQTVPYTTYPPLGSTTPEDLWKALQAYQDKTGGQVLAIAHNGNLSNGWMFPWDVNPASKQPLTREYAETRMRWEPLYETTQIKGDGEAHPFLSKNDEFANFETWDKGNLNLSEKKKNEMLQGEYARTALQTGLQLEAKLGVNPYKFGQVGFHRCAHLADHGRRQQLLGQDTVERAEPRAGFAPVPEDQRRHHHGLGAGRIRLRRGVGHREHARRPLGRDEAQGNLCHHRTAHDGAVLRRLGLRRGDAAATDLATTGYDKGVPMGGDLKTAAAGKVPTFLVAAMKDPEGGNLDRIQIIKGWVDAKGARQEKVYDVVWSGDRKPGADGKVPAVGNTVDVPNATYTNTIGAPQLASFWKDPEFDASLRAVYYVRVLEIPTPRWTAYDAKNFKLKMAKEVRMVTQERAYTSPIWYTP